MDVPILNVLSVQHGAVKGSEQLEYKDCFTVVKTEQLQLELQYSIRAKIINHENLMIIGVLKRREFEQGSYLMIMHDYCSG